MKKYALYIRVSTDFQFEEGYSVDAQKEMLAAYCKSRNVKDYEFYIDGGWSGSNIERPRIQQLIEDIKHDKISAVVVYKLDRLSRSQKDTLYLIEDVFNKHDVAFISLNESLDTGTPMGKAMLGVLAVFAQLERENIRERTQMGMKERVKNGYWMGGDRIPFGYDYDRSLGILVPNKDADTVRNIYELYLSGYSMCSIARLLNLCSDNLVKGILTKKTYLGLTYYKGELYQGKHEPIISEELYYKVQKELKVRNSNISKRTNPYYLLVGLIYCGHCGAKMRYQKWGKEKTKIYCHSHSKSKPNMIKDPNCPSKKFWSKDIEDVVINDLFKFSLNYKKNKTTSPIKTNLEILENKISNSNQKIKKLYDLYANDSNPLLLEVIEQEKAVNQNLLNQIYIEKESIKEKEGEYLREDEIRSLSKTWNTMSAQTKQNIVRHIIDKIVISNDNIEIYYKI